MDNESRSGRSSQVYLRIENKIPFFLENFPFQSQQATLIMVFQSGIHLLLSGAISEVALITRYFGTIETY